MLVTEYRKRQLNTKKVTFSLWVGLKKIRGRTQRAAGLQPQYLVSPGQRGDRGGGRGHRPSTDKHTFTVCVFKVLHVHERTANVTLVHVCLRMTCLLQADDVAAPGESQPGHVLVMMMVVAARGGRGGIWLLSNKPGESQRG